MMRRMAIPTILGLLAISALRAYVSYFGDSTLSAIAVYGATAPIAWSLWRYANHYLDVRAGSTRRGDR